MAALPIPRTTTDELLVAVHTELVGLRADLAASRGGEPAAQPGGQVLLTEPEQPAAAKPKSPAKATARAKA
jgi:hypothetical protein